MLVPVGSPAFRLNLLGCACAATAAIVLGAATAGLVRRLGGRDLPAAVAGLFAAAVWGFSDAFWWEAVIGDKYPLFYLAFAAILWLSARPDSGAGEASAPGPRPLLLAGLLVGLALTHHLYSVFALPAVGWVLYRFWTGGNPGRVRTVLLAAVLGLLPFSLRLVYPPVRSEARVERDWGSPRIAVRFMRYSLAVRYSEAYTDNMPSGWAWGSRLALVGRILAEEIPLPLLLGIPAGAWALARGAPGWSLAAGAAALIDLGYSVNYSERIARWYEPLYAVVILVSAVGFSRMAVWAGRFATPAILLVSVLAGGWQFGRGLDRNSLARFYAAHDFGRNMLMSLPRGAIYLGSGDRDLFPLWALESVSGERPDVTMAAMSAFVDLNPADATGVDRVCVLTGVPRRGWEGLREILSLGAQDRYPVMIAKTGYEYHLWEVLGPAVAHTGYGMAGRISPGWNPEESYRVTRRLFGAYSLRGLTHDRVGALFDLDRPRDEIARDGLLHYSSSLVSLGLQLQHYGGGKSDTEASWAYNRARKLLEPLTGLGSVAYPGGCQGERIALELGYRRLSAIFRSRGVDALAILYGNMADMLSSGI
jgi:hypothetical protein